MKKTLFAFLASMVLTFGAFSLTATASGEELGYPAGDDEQCGNQTCASPWYTNADWKKWIRCCCRTNGNVFKKCDKEIQWYTRNGTTDRCYVQLNRYLHDDGCTPGTSSCGQQQYGDCGLLSTEP